MARKSMSRWTGERSRSSAGGGEDVRKGSRRKSSESMEMEEETLWSMKTRKLMWIPSQRWGKNERTLKGKEILSGRKQHTTEQLRAVT
eukprot:752009-Hanusia_phi.AAC.2